MPKAWWSAFTIGLLVIIVVTTVLNIMTYNEWIIKGHLGKVIPSLKNNKGRQLKWFWICIIFRMLWLVAYTILYSIITLPGDEYGPSCAISILATSPVLILVMFVTSIIIYARSIKEE